jgi:hypothetical protein
MKKNSAFKLRSGNKPSIAKMFGMMKTFKKNMQRLKDQRAKVDMTKAPKAMQNLNKAFTPKNKKAFTPKNKKAFTPKTKQDPLTKNILDTSQKGDEALRPTVSNQTFNQAFASARKARKKIFSFKGKKYTTELAKNKKKSKNTNAIDFIKNKNYVPKF